MGKATKVSDPESFTWVACPGMLGNATKVMGNATKVSDPESFTLRKGLWAAIGVAKDAMWTSIWDRFGFYLDRTQIVFKLEAN